MTNPIIRMRDFFSEVVGELKKSSWPTRQDLVDSTVVVVATVLILGVFVAFADFIFLKVVALLTQSA